MILDELLAKRLVLLSGKGGVGKSLVGAALALAARDRGRRVLLVEVDAPLEASRYLDAAPAGHRVAEALPGLFTINLDPAQVMAEYVRHLVKLDYLVRKILDSPVYQRFFAAAPGLPELMVLGKIMMLEEERQGRRPRFDLILVDAPATGHGLSFLRVPQAASRAVPVGPVGRNARRILDLLRDHERTAVVVVAIPEEMAVVEAAEFHRSATEEVGIHAACAVLNMCHERRFTPDQEARVLRLAAEGASGRLDRDVPLDAALAAGRRHVRRRKLTRFYLGRLRRVLPIPVVSLPYLFEEEPGRETVQELARRLEAA
jgi:anion-transporting  ArsA/GET3 family ATPase